MYNLLIIFMLIYTSKLIMDGIYLYDICHSSCNIYPFFTVTIVTRFVSKNVGL